MSCEGCTYNVQSMYMHIACMYILTMEVSWSQERTRVVLHLVSPLQELPLVYSSTTPFPPLSREGGEVAIPRLSAFLRCVLNIHVHVHVHVYNIQNMHMYNVHEQGSS